LTPSADDIQSLIAGCIKNDRRAQEQLYKLFHNAMAALCMRYAKNMEDATEVMNDGFLKVFKNIQQYEAGKAAISTWIRTIMIHAAIDFLRKKKVNYIDKPLYEEEAGIENEAIQKTDADILLAMIRQLPTATQLVFNLYAIDGFNHVEIASLLDISEGTSRWHVSEARKQLKQLLQTQQLKNE